MPANHITCIVCSASAPDGSPYHKITYERTEGKQDEPSLAERVCKLLKTDIYSPPKAMAYHILMMCSGCLQEMTEIENAEKAKKKFKKCLKRNLADVSSGAGVVRKERKRQSQMSGDKARKERRFDCELSSSDLELCVKEIDELITHVLQDELMSKSKTSAEKMEDSGLLSTEVAILKETFSEMEKQLRNFESSSKTSGSTRHATESVIWELLMKHRITSEYKDKMVQHLNKMVSYISKHKSKFECNAEGLQKFCRILAVIYSPGSNDEVEEIDIADDSSTSSMSSSLSSISCGSITVNLMQSVDVIFKQSAAQIADAWRETSGNGETRTDQPPHTAKPQETTIPQQTVRSPKTTEMSKSPVQTRQPSSIVKGQKAVLSPPTTMDAENSQQSPKLSQAVKPPQTVKLPQAAKSPQTAKSPQPSKSPLTTAKNPKPQQPAELPQESNSRPGNVKLPRNFSATGVVYGDMINSPPQPVTKEKQKESTHALREEDEMVIGSQMQKIINGQENDNEVIDIESVGSDEEGDEVPPDGDIAKSGDDGGKESVGDKKVDDGSGEASLSSTSSNQPMVIGDTTDEEEEEMEEEKGLDQNGSIKVEKDPIPSSQDDIQEVEQAKKPAPVVICIDSDDDETEEDESKKKKSGDDMSKESPSKDASMLSYEETRWTHMKAKKPDCFIVSQSTPAPAASQSMPNQQDSNSRPGNGKLPKNFSARGVVYGDMINKPPSTQSQPNAAPSTQSQPHTAPSTQSQPHAAKQNTSNSVTVPNLGFIQSRTRQAPQGRQYEPVTKRNQAPRYTSVAGVVHGNMVSGNELSSGQAAAKHFTFKKNTSSGSPAKDHFGGGHWQQQNFSGFGRKKFNFKKQSKHKRYINQLAYMNQGKQQGNVNIMNAPNANRRNKQKFQFKGKKFKPNPSQSGGGPSGTTSKLDIIPVIHGRLESGQPSPTVIRNQGPQHRQNPANSTAPVNSKKQKFKFKKKQGKQKKQHHYNQGSKPVVAKQPGNHGNSQSKTQKTNQPAVMRVLGGSAQTKTVNVQANWS